MDAGSSPARNRAPSPPPASEATSPREHGPSGGAAAGAGGLLARIPGVSLVSSGFRLVGSILDAVVSPIRTVVGGTASPPADGMAAARQFISNFEQTYGSGGPPFLECSYVDALAQAQADSRMILIYLHAELNQDTDAFCRNTLRDPQVVERMRRHYLVWGGDVTEPFALEASARFAASSYPFVGIYIPVAQNKYQRVYHLEGMASPETFASHLDQAVQEAQPALDRIQAQRVAIEADRRLREEQNEAYERALAEDREKERKKEEEAEAKALEEAKAMSEQLNKEAELKRIRGRIPPEPPAGKGTTSVRITLPNGAKVQRRFLPTDEIQIVFDFVTLTLADLNAPVSKFELGCSFPRKTYSPSDDLTVNLQDAGLHPQAVLFVTPLTA